jgi:hypothetical protein
MRRFGGVTRGIGEQGANALLIGLLCFGICRKLTKIKHWTR